MLIRGGRGEEESYKMQRSLKAMWKGGAEILIKDRNWDLGQSFFGYYCRTRTNPDKIIRVWPVGAVQEECVESRLTSHIQEMIENPKQSSCRNLRP